MYRHPSDYPICFLRPRRIALSAWSEHVPFAMYLVELLRPDTLVELGTRNGVSYSAFCQAVDSLALSTNCMAVDTWQGDAHTGRYGPSVIEDLRAHHDPLYSAFSHLNQTTFDEAALSTAPASVDLLHIDGFHTYEAVRHDFETWRPKLSPRAVVLFHDIAERGRGFGVWQLWEQLTAQFPSFDFLHGHGLGILGVGTETPTAVASLFSLSPQDRQDVRRFFHRLGRRVTFRTMLAYAALAPARLVGVARMLGRRLAADAAARS